MAGEVEQRMLLTKSADLIIGRWGSTHIPSCLSLKMVIGVPYHIRPAWGQPRVSTQCGCGTQETRYSGGAFLVPVGPESSEETFSSQPGMSQQIDHWLVHPSLGYATAGDASLGAGSDAAEFGPMDFKCEPAVSQQPATGLSGSARPSGSVALHAPQLLPPYSHFAGRVLPSMQGPPGGPADASVSEFRSPGFSQEAEMLLKAAERRCC